MAAMEIDRRTMLAGTAALPFATESIAAVAASGDWDRIAREYDVTREVIQLEHGNWGMMARPVLDEYRRFYNEARPHQGIAQRRPAGFCAPENSAKPVDGAAVVSRAVLGGLHHAYERIA